MYGLSVVTAPAEEPVSLAEAKTHLRVEHDDDDAYISALISAARESAEQYLHRALITQTLKMSLDAFPAVIRLPRSPVQSITSIQYVDDAGETQTLDASDYRLDKESIVARIEPAYGETWPTTRPVSNAVTVTFVAGYGAASAVPAPVKQAMKLHIGTYYDIVRANVALGAVPAAMPQAADYLLGPFRVATHAGAA